MGARQFCVKTIRHWSVLCHLTARRAVRRSAAIPRIFPPPVAAALETVGRNSEAYCADYRS